MGLLLTTLGVAVFGSYVANGGFVSDDWSRAANYRYANPPRVLNQAIDTSRQEAGARPLLALSLSTSNALFGLHRELHLALALVIAIFVSIALFVVLRTAGMAPLHAGGIAALALLFPWSDANRLWATDGVHNLSVLLFLLGVVAALRAFRASGRRRAVLGATASTLYAMSVLSYESAIPLLLVSPLIYLWCAPRQAVLKRWRIDVAIAIGGLLVVALTTERHLGSFGHLVDAGVQHGREAVGLLGFAVIPQGGHAWISLLALGLLTAAVAIAWWRLPSGRELDATVRRWLLLAGTACLLIAAAYTIYIGSGLTPLAKGQDNRGNILAALGWVTLVYALVMVAVTVFAAHLRSRGRWPSRLLGALAVALVATGYLVQVDVDKGHWRRASEMGRHLLRSVQRTVPNPPRGATFYTFGHPAQLSPGVSVFAATWDLKGALRLTYDDRTLRGYPIYSGTKFRCGARSLFPRSSPPKYDIGTDGYGRKQGAAYGKAIFVDVAARRARTIRNQHECGVASRAFRPGPFVLENG